MRTSFKDGGSLRPARSTRPRQDWSRFLEWLCVLCQGITETMPAERRPREQLSDVVFCLVLKIYGKFSYDLLISFLDSLDTGKYLSHVPSAMTLNNYMRDEKLTPILKKLIGESSLPLRGIETHFAIDSTPLFLHSYYLSVDSKTKKKVERRDWIRLHLVCGVKTGIVPSADATLRIVAEQKLFEPLVRELLLLGFEVRGIAGDKNYLSRKNVTLVTELGATPYLTFKKNSRKREGDNQEWVESFDKFKAQDAAVIPHYRE